ncbi:aminoacyltransferase [Streptococcus halotolerans]|uniref:aminoacyltransferase n=1 Tax=Streptococcus halotolerans TaxID=1814128 RepID=UPI000787044B|nr:aminoacyltransferase [Streptococcus halotolerans]
MPVKVLSWDVFDHFVNHAKHRNFEQSSEMGALLEKRGYQVSPIGYVDDNDHVQVAAIVYSTPVAGGLYSEIHYGPVFDNSKYLLPFLEGLKEFAKANNTIELAVKPYESYQQFDDNGDAISPQNQELIAIFKEAGYQFQGLTTGFETSDWHYVKSLKNIETSKLINSFSKKGKGLVKKANTFGIKLHKLDREELTIFKEITAATSERRKYNDKPLDYYQKLYDAFGERAEFIAATLNFKDYLNQVNSEHQRVLEQLQSIENDLSENPNSAKKKKELQQILKLEQTFITREKEAQQLIDQYGDEDQFLAASLFIFTPQETTYFLSGSYPEFNKFYAPALLQEYAMKESIKRGIPFYNFLGIAGSFDGSDGILRFKQNFNGYIERRPGSFNYYPKPRKYFLIKQFKKIMGRL